MFDPRIFNAGSEMIRRPRRLVHEVAPQGEPKAERSLRVLKDMVATHTSEVTKALREAMTVSPEECCRNHILRCATPNCPNRSDQGAFEGKYCFPCFERDHCPSSTEGWVEVELISNRITNRKWERGQRAVMFYNDGTWGCFGFTVHKTWASLLADIERTEKGTQCHSNQDKPSTPSPISTATPVNTTGNTIGSTSSRVGQMMRLTDMGVGARFKSDTGCENMITAINPGNIHGYTTRTEKFGGYQHSPTLYELIAEPVVECGDIVRSEDGFIGKVFRFFGERVYFRKINDEMIQYSCSLVNVKIIEKVGHKG